MGLGHNDPWVESHIRPQQMWGQRSSRGQWPLVQVFTKTVTVSTYFDVCSGETRGSRTTCAWSHYLLHRTQRSISLIVVAHHLLPGRGCFGKAKKLIKRDESAEDLIRQQERDLEDEINTGTSFREDRKGGLASPLWETQELGKKYFTCSCHLNIRQDLFRSHDFVIVSRNYKLILAHMQLTWDKSNACALRFGICLMNEACRAESIGQASKCSKKSTLIYHILKQKR